MTSTGKRMVDRRIQKTRRHLHDALSTLIHQKPYDAIAVKEILARADVARSTFYTHFRDKDELLTSGIQDVIRSGRPVKCSVTEDIGAQHCRETFSLDTSPRRSCSS